jgi:peptide deformylase
MALLSILKYGDKRLETPAHDVEEIDETINTIIQDMLETMYAAPGIGLAATQVGIPLRIATIDLSRGEEKNELIILINPEIIFQEENVQEEEGCLSFPEIYAPVNRPSKVVVHTHNVNGQFVEITGEGLLARALSHECDHLSGILFLERMNSLTKELIKKQIAKKMKQGEWQ